MAEIQLIETTVHGRAMLERDGRSRLLVGFHGYGEDAATHMDQLVRIPAAGEWSLLAIQALHPFYVRSTQAVVASWMTRLDRETAIADNLAYVARVLARQRPFEKRVFLGFSQGAAMAYRAAAALGCDGLIALGGDIPPDVSDPSRLPPLLIGRGSTDSWFTREKLEKDLRFLEGHPVRTCLFDGGHEWADPFLEAASAFLATI